MFKRIELIEAARPHQKLPTWYAAGSNPKRSCLFCSNSNHTRDHVLEELRLYGPMVTPGSYIVATDGIMAQVVGGQRTKPEWAWNNPLGAIDAFIAENPNFAVDEPKWPFNEGTVKERVTYWPKAYLRRRCIAGAHLRAACGNFPANQAKA